MNFRPPSLLLVLFLFVCVDLCAASAQEATKDASGSDEKPKAEAIVAVSDVNDDEAIKNRLERVFAATDWYESLEVKCDNGIVLLTGVSNTEQHRQWAEDLAGRTEDVIAVVNNLEVAPAETIDLSISATVVEKSLSQIWRDFLARTPLLIAAILIIAVTTFFSKVISWLLVRLLDRRTMRSSLKDLFYQLATIAIWIVGFLVATVVAFPGMTPSKALAVLGLGSVAVGFAFKDIFENFFAGILILWRYPFDRGDFIRTGDLTGKVEQVTIRNTMIRKLDGELAVVPNATIFKNTVDVLTDQPQRRVRIICGVAYDEDVATARDVISKAVQSCETVQGKRMVQVFANEFADSSINFEIVWWTGSKPVDVRRSRDEVVTAIKQKLDDAGIEIPFPYRTLTFKNESDANSLDAFSHKSVDAGAPSPEMISE